MSFQNLTPKRGYYKPLFIINGKTLIGSRIDAPYAVNKNLRVCLWKQFLQPKVLVWSLVFHQILQMILLPQETWPINQSTMELKKTGYKQILFLLSIPKNTVISVLSFWLMI